LTLTLTGTVYDGETVTVSYDDATALGPIADAASNPLADITDAAVTNNSTVAPSYAVTGNPTTVLVDVESAQMTLAGTGAQITETDSVTITATNPVGGATLTDVTVRVYVDDVEQAVGTEGGITYEPAEPLSAYQFTIESASVQTVRLTFASSADWSDPADIDIEIVEPGEGTGAALISAFGYGFGF
jgi:hypothetical protein